MYLAYLDESGDSGLTNSPTRWFVLSCVLVHHADWLSTLNLLVDLRRDLRSNFQIPTRREIKGIHFKKGKGALKTLGSPGDRLDLYRALLAYQSQNLPIRVFAIAVQKAPAAARSWEPRTAAWTFALQRINRFCEGEKDSAMIFPDEGHGFFIRRRIRAMRRFHSVPSYWGGSTRRFEIKRIIEDPSDRSSSDSYFIQLADWNAFVAHRSKYVDAKAGFPNDLWDELDQVLLREVNKLRGGPPGIVVYP
jgi:hypothetical protein